jgi:hypothetical protein
MPSSQKMTLVENNQPVSIGHWYDQALLDTARRIQIFSEKETSPVDNKSSSPMKADLAV